MHSILKTVIQWTVFIIAVVLCILCFCVPLVALIYCPEAAVVANFSKAMAVFSGVVGVLSAAMGAFSIWQAQESAKQANQLLQKIDALTVSQETFLRIMTENATQTHINKQQPNDQDWKIDSTGKNQ